ncbi:hypothetical protein LTR12_016056 [Friedmanniomyces endolithicus]|nr:hypothetical protein LTR12_016056 [Friedmanniomyces endolithicus]
MTKRIARGIYKPRSPWSALALLAEMRRLYRRPEMQWKTKEQEHALATIMLWREQVVAILPTGACKSMLFMLPCTLPNAGTTILVVPLVALRADLIRRVQELGINHLEWTPGERREASLVFVRVKRHALRTSSTTLPPLMRADFEERNLLHQPTVIRASTNRLNILYIVRKAQQGHGSLLEQAAAEARAAWEESGLFDHAHDKIIPYVRTREEATTLSRLLTSESYTAESGSTVEKQRILEKGVSRPDQPFIVATSALAEGFDYPHVRFIVNVNEPESLVIFAQESGRAGRDGQKAYSLVLLAPTWQPQDDGKPDVPEPSFRFDDGWRKEQERHAVHRYLRGEQCYRTSLTEYLDDAKHRRWCMPEDVPTIAVRQAERDPALSPVEGWAAARGLSRICAAVSGVPQRRGSRVWLLGLCVVE